MAKIYSVKKALPVRIMDSIFIIPLLFLEMFVASIHWLEHVFSTYFYIRLSYNYEF